MCKDKYGKREKGALLEQKGVHEQSERKPGSYGRSHSSSRRPKLSVGKGRKAKTKSVAGSLKPEHGDWSPCFTGNRDVGSLATAWKH